MPEQSDLSRRHWEATRDIPHEEARAIAKRFIDGHFKNDAERPRVGIPARPDYDDDLLLYSYINQQERTIDAQAAENAALREALEHCRQTLVLVAHSPRTATAEWMRSMLLAELAALNPQPETGEMDDAALSKGASHDG